MTNYQHPSPIALTQSEMTPLARDQKSTIPHQIPSRLISQQNQNQVMITPQTILENSSNSSLSGTPKKQMLFLKQSLAKSSNQTCQLELKYQQFIPKKLQKYRLNLLTTKSTQNQKEHTQNDKPFSSLSIPTSNQSQLNLLALGLSRKKTALNQIEAQQDCKIYKNGIWSKTKLMMFESSMSFFQFSFNIVDLKKIKILPSNATKIKVQNIIKLQIKEEVSLISIATDKKYKNLPTSFFLFAKLITKKLYQQTLLPSPSPKASTVSTFQTNDSYIHGQIYKKSQHLGNWQKRYIIIKSDGIYSYKDSKQQQSHTFYISNQSVRYIWTRFHTIQSYLIIKVKHGISKTQFGIPIGEYTQKSTGNWLYGFYRTMAGRRIN